MRSLLSTDASISTRPSLLGRLRDVADHASWQRLIATDIQFKETRDLSIESVVALYKAVGWSSAEKPEALHRGLLNSHSLVTARSGDRLVGLGNAISDGHLVAYYSHLLVHPDYQG